MKPTRLAQNAAPRLRFGAPIGVLDGGRSVPSTT
jgi:hypothetical protein